MRVESRRGRRRARKYEDELELRDGEQYELIVAGEEIRAELASQTPHLADVTRDYLDWCETNNRPSTVRWKRTACTAIVERWPDLVAGELTLGHVRRWKSALRKGGRGHATVNRYLATLRHLYTWMLEEDLVTPAMHRAVHRERLLTEPPPRARWLTDDERDRLLGECRGVLALAVLIAIYTGIRLGRIQALRWSDIDLERRRVRVRDSKTGAARHVPICKTLGDVLCDVRPENARATAVLVSHRTGRPVTVSGLQTAWQRARARAELTDLRFHDLRHHFASTLAQRGVTLRVIRDLLGHAPSTGMQMVLRYAHLADKNLEDAVAVLDD